MEQFCLWLPPKTRTSSRWKKDTENGCRMWRCPDCGGRMIGNVWDEGFCPYEFCPYCGVRNGKRPYSGRRLG